jgi:hypothetical protein
VSTSLYSLYSYEYGRYKPFEKLDLSNGFYVGCKMAGTLDPMSGFEETIGKLDGVEGIYEVYRGYISTAAKGYNAYLYDEWIWKNWEARLKSGSWFSDDQKDTDTVQVILSGNIEGYAVGDVFTVQTDTGSCQLLVKGILQDHTEIPYSNSYHASDMTYDSCYSVPGENEKFILLQKEAADEKGIAGNASGVWAIVGYKEGISEEETTELNNYINKMVGITGRPYGVFLKLSADALEGKILVYIPMIAAGIVLGLISLFTVAFINIEKGAKYYKIYYLTGANKRQCFQIACGNVIGTIFVSVFAYVLGNDLIILYTRKANITYGMMSGAVLLAMGIYCVFALFLMLCMYLAMSANSPLELLRRRM